MLPGLLRALVDLPLFEYISFRAAMAGLTAFALALVSGRPVIAWLVKRKALEDVSKKDAVALAEHAERLGKSGTPTMGGSFLVASLVLSTLLWCRLDNVHVVLAILLVAGLAAVGFIDDYRKLTVRGSSGLSARAKLLGQTVVTLFVVGALVWYARTSGRHTLLEVHLPLLKDAVLPLGESLPGLVLFVFFAWLVIAGTANATNITDGLDGLAAGCTIITCLALAIFCYVTGRPDYSRYLNLPHIQEASEMAVVGGALCGACMGFLWYNAFPARVFMGDSGSLPIGGLMAWMALISKQELVLPLLGFVFFAEMGSSALQRVWYRRSGGRRVFTMAPIHEGLKLHGGIFRPGPAPWHEVTIVIRAWIVAAVCAMASLALLKVR